MSPEDRFRHFDGPNWPKVPADPEPVDDHEDAISWHEVAGLLQVATIVALSIAAVFAVGAITGGVL